MYLNIQEVHLLSDSTKAPWPLHGHLALQDVLTHLLTIVTVLHSPSERREALAAECKSGREEELPIFVSAPNLYMAWWLAGRKQHNRRSRSNCLGCEL